MQIFAGKRYKIVVLAYFEKGKRAKNVKRLSQNLVQGSVKTWSKYVAQHKWTKF